MSHRGLLTNISLLYGLQVANYLIPLVTLPYLGRTLGPDAFGSLAISSNVFLVLGILIDWGFSLTAVQQASHARADPERLREIFWETIFARTLLTVVALALLGVLMAVSPALQAIRWVILFGALQLVPIMLGTGWFLQGVERIGSLVTATLCSRALTIPATLWLVHSPADAAQAALIPGMIGLISTAVAFRMAGQVIPLWPIHVNWRGVGRQLRSGLSIFVSTAAIALSADSHALILTTLASPEQVGIFSGADRIRRALQSLIGPLSGALYPRINHLVVADRRQARRMMLVMLLAQGSFTCALGACMYLLAPILVPLFLGPAFQASVPVAQALAPFVALCGFTNVLGTNVMIPLGLTTSFMTIEIASVFVNLIGMLCLCPHYGALGAALSATTTETFVTLAMALRLGWHRRGSLAAIDTTASLRAIVADRMARPGRLDGLFARAVAARGFRIRRKA